MMQEYQKYRLEQRKVASEESITALQTMQHEDKEYIGTREVGTKIWEPKRETREKARKKETKSYSFTVVIVIWVPM